MQKFFKFVTFVFLFSFSFSIFAQDTKQPIPKADMLTVKGAIGPAVADYLVRGIKQAGESKKDFVIIKMDTPGGLSKSMRVIIQSIINSKIPVVTYVAPSGARAASAGTYILYASHVAAMAPGTNLGAASPVALGMPSSTSKDKEGKPVTDEKGNPVPKSTLERKAMNDAVAYIRSLAELRGRNADWAEDAVRKASSLSSTEALAKKVIDYVATDVNNLMTQINGREVKVEDKTITLQTENIVIEKKDPDWRSRFLSIITDPSFAYMLMLLGVYGLFLEFTNPGMIFPGVIGAIALLLALYAFALLPINYVGLGLMFIGIAFMVAEVFVTSFGVLGVGGVIAFIIGSVMLIDTEFPGFDIAIWLIVSVGIVTGLFVMLILNMAIRTRSRPVVSGREALIGSEGTVVKIEGDRLTVRVTGELWQAQSENPVSIGQKITVVSLDGLILKVVPKSLQQTQSKED